MCLKWKIITLPLKPEYIYLTENGKYIHQGIEQSTQNFKKGYEYISKLHKFVYQNNCLSLRTSLDSYVCGLQGKCGIFHVEFGFNDLYILPLMKRR